MADFKHVYTIVEREGQEKNRWVRVGVAFVNRDQSLNIRLNALPVNGLLHVRDPHPLSNGDSAPTTASD
jgi:hypothetical protein